MVLIRWRPFREMEILHRQMDRIFDDFLSSSFFDTSPNVLLPKPTIELRDNPDNLTLRAEIPGANSDNLEVQVTQQAVMITGEIRDDNQANKRGFYHSEIRYGKFQRIINLPVNIENERVNAEFKNGILTLILPKVKNSQSQIVKINFAEEKPMLLSTDSPKILDVPAQQS
jgi:HSP20 family protein